MSTTFKVGDIVTPKGIHLQDVLAQVGPSADGTYTITSVRESNGDTTLIDVEAYDKKAWRTSGSVYAHRFELAPFRVEGKEIAPKAIQTGDEIRVTRVGTEGITHSRQGVVNRIIETEDKYGHGLLLKVGYGARLNWGQGLAETFTLVKAAPERDLVLERLNESGTGQIITFGAYLACRNANTTWTLLNGVKATVESAFRLRGLIGEAEVKWMKPEAK